MNSISRNKYIDKSATPLKAYFTLASAHERAQTTYARRRVRIHARARTWHTHVHTSKQTSRSERKRGGRTREASKRERRGAGVLIEEWFAPSIKNLVCFWPTDIEEKLFASGI